MFNVCLCVLWYIYIYFICSYILFFNLTHNTDFFFITYIVNSTSNKSYHLFRKRLPLESLNGNPLCTFVHSTFCNSSQPTHDLSASRALAATKVRKTISSRVHEAVKAIALVHNVTPVYESNGVTDQAEAEQHYEDTCRVYQASSPDEV